MEAVMVFAATAASSSELMPNQQMGSHFRALPSACEQKVGCLKKRGMNLWSWTTATLFFFRAPFRALVRPPFLAKPPSSDLKVEEVGVVAVVVAVVTVDWLLLLELPPPPPPPLPPPSMEFVVTVLLVVDVLEQLVVERRSLEEQETMEMEDEEERE
ncbi:hypothetical protein TYRP_015279 [Tyrophagus putrescentiae]|nr:hypothetical protein TYRP_015279 [Tyrophagus putrescentiae]